MISSMKKAKIVILKDDLDKVLKEIQNAGCLMITEQSVSANHSLSYEGLIARCVQSLKTVEKYQKKKGLFAPYLQTDFDTLENIDDSTMDIVTEIEDGVGRLSQIDIEIKALEEEIKNLSVFSSLAIPLNQIGSTKYTMTHVGFILNKNVELFDNLMNEYGCEYQKFEVVKNQIGVCYTSFLDDDEELTEKLKEVSFSDTTLPVFDGLLDEYSQSLSDKIKALEDEKQGIKDMIAGHLNDSESVKNYVDHLLTVQARNDSDFSETVDVYVIDGWVPDDKLKELKEAIEKATSYYDIEFRYPEEDDDVPTYVENKKLVKPFESVTNMFSIPSWKELDPNPVMSIWYWLLFGMMMGDVGYGFIMLIVGILFIKLTHPKEGMANIAKIITYSGISTILWGIFFNSYFGASLPFYKPVIGIMDQPMEMLILSVAVGALHIITGLIMKAVRDFKNKEYQEMIGKDLSWILLLVGLGVTVVSMTSASSSNIAAYILGAYGKYFGIGLLIIGLAMILLFAGHAKKNIIGRAAGGLLGLYDVTSYLGDLLSYSRIMALVMSSASIAYVMNTLAQMVKGPGFFGMIPCIIVYIIGHAFNLVLGLLSAYVHDCRLQYIEFYGKFYDGGGKLFKPLTVQTKYNDIKK